MKKVGYIILLLVLACNIVAAQPQQRYERIHAIKVAFITDKLKLTSDQAAKFWPVYNDYEDELRATRMSFLNKYPDKQNMGREQARRFVEDNLDYQEAEIKLKRKYKDQFLKIISDQQMAALYQADREFKKMLIEQLRQKRGNRPAMK